MLNHKRPAAIANTERLAKRKSCCLVGLSSSCAARVIVPATKIQKRLPANLKFGAVRNQKIRDATEGSRKSHGTS
jgi:hypothetical protein